MLCSNFSWDVETSYGAKRKQTLPLYIELLPDGSGDFSNATRVPCADSTKVKLNRDTTEVGE